MLYEKMETTLAKAKIIRPYVERLITSAKIDTLAARRAALAKLTDKKAVKKLFEEIGPRYKTRAGGYTRIRRVQTRLSDSAECAIISLIE
ncbi:MAG: 50S ribosomal protein L17 [Candidatus Komeilibacteria bacterium]|nr:50S ribosomal protein L17 [Candidatus Komeilibacteria bacterium]